MLILTSVGHTRKQTERVTGLCMNQHFPHMTSKLYKHQHVPYTAFKLLQSEWNSKCSKDNIEKKMLTSDPHLFLMSHFLRAAVVASARDFNPQVVPR